MPGGLAATGTIPETAGGPLLPPKRRFRIVLNYNLQDYDRDNRFESRLSDLVVKFNYTFRY